MLQRLLLGDRSEAQVSEHFRRI